MFKDKCDYCGETMKSPYTFNHNGEWYVCHKYCCFAMKQKLKGDGAYAEQLEFDFERGGIKGEPK